MSKIKILDESTIQQIAAGEVIERPSSIVKELIENSIDAGSDNIIIEIQDGGKSYIRVTDNGEGMNKEDIELAFKRHSTSKLQTVEDIYNVLSLGFRGEALASISSVSDVEVLSKTKNSDIGIQAFVKNGHVVESNSIGCPKGTTIIVRNIFYNLPVRQKFLKSSNIESNHISEIINKLALGNSKVSFKFIKDGNIILKTPQNNTLLNTIYSVLGKDYHKNLIPINYLVNDLKISGFISNNNLYRANRNHQYLYINGRYISNLNLSKIIEKQYKSLIPLNRLPVFILNIELSPNEVDINIHPTKQEVKFVNSEYIYNNITNIIREKLMPSVVVPEMKPFNNKGEDKNPLPELFDSLDYTDKIEDKKDEKDINIIVKDLALDTYTLDNYTGKKEVFSVVDEKEKLSNYNKKYLNISSNKSLYKDEVVVEQKIEDILLDIKPIGRVFNTYILAESKNENKLFFIDQHAAHERIMYEKYRREYENEKIITQGLLYPEVLQLTNQELDMVNENKDLFEKLGFILDEFGDNSIALRGVPMIFGEPKIKDLFLDILDGLSKNIKNNYETKIEKIMKISCTNAIKSGDKIDNLEIMTLFEDLKKCNNPYTCPHGRPTLIELSKKDIEKQFLRIL
ncbi:DNA mismatch repair endonuclease MutL [Tissierella creatinophila]|uniref:DNA mismatch repair protein MutL n=1 Tax=Tissierella creatinophila DSM 6911 TaxID=1123403 RepID=A0A1U7M9K5_TISCR|nr:DNA mismatch repair endonuclease MutL [Tissierella creatinophila]OLS03966.1 DNA mismatch repair protein MutL [Tissierella creatinophila DSM 6911]